MHPYATYFIILLRLKPDDFTHQGESASKTNLSCVYMRKFHPACRDNFVVLTVIKIACSGIFELSSWKTGEPGQ
jgi:hypothetical protein